MNHSELQHKLASGGQAREKSRRFCVTSHWLKLKPVIFEIAWFNVSSTKDVPSQINANKHFLPQLKNKQ